MRPLGLLLLILCCLPGAAAAQDASAQSLLALHAGGNLPHFCREVGRYLDHHPDDPQTAALLLCSADCSDQALGRIAVYRQVLRIEPQGAEAGSAALALAELSYLLGDYASALEATRVLIEGKYSVPEVLRAHRLAADCHRARGHPDLAARDLRALLEAASEGYGPIDAARVDLAQIELEAGRPRQAIELCRTLIPDGDPEQLPRALLIAGRAHLALAEPGAAARMFNATLIFGSSEQAEQARLLLRSSSPVHDNPLTYQTQDAFAIVLGPFGDERSAASAAEMVAVLGYGARPRVAGVQQQVRVGPFDAEVDAFLALRRIERELGLKGRLERIQ
ncbi:MAG: hypothetical protein P9M14_00095 [Candidatus Alcyoniella australis]|nr:hypothetical protein [Candidatus Alcyoniella australis]